MIESLVLASVLSVSSAPIATCDDRRVQILEDAGFQGRDRRAAFAIVWRESRFTNLGPGDALWNTQDWGWWQLNKPTWGDEDWWSDTSMLNPREQSRIVYRMTKHGRDWRHWGIGEAHGRYGLDPTYYQGIWSDAQMQSWIVAPFNEGWSKFPKACR